MVMAMLAHGMRSSPLFHANILRVVAWLETSIRKSLLYDSTTCRNEHNHAFRFCQPRPVFDKAVILLEFGFILSSAMLVDELLSQRKRFYGLRTCQRGMANTRLPALCFSAQIVIVRDRIWEENGKINPVVSLRCPAKRTRAFIRSRVTMKD